MRVRMLHAAQAQLHAAEQLHAQHQQVYMQSQAALAAAPANIGPPRP